VDRSSESVSSPFFFLLLLLSLRNSLLALYHHIQGAIKNIDDIRFAFEEIACVLLSQETFSSSDILDWKVDVRDHYLYRQDRPDKFTRRDGVAMYVRNGIRHEFRVTSKKLEVVSMVVVSRRSNIIVCQT
jgi:hypothetical protein